MNSAWRRRAAAVSALPERAGTAQRAFARVHAEQPRAAARAQPSAARKGAPSGAPMWRRPTKQQHRSPPPRAGTGPGPPLPTQVKALRQRVWRVVRHQQRLGRVHMCSATPQPATHVCTVSRTVRARTRPRPARACCPVPQIMAQRNSKQQHGCLVRAVMSSVAAACVRRLRCPVAAKQRRHRQHACSATLSCTAAPCAPLWRAILRRCLGGSRAQAQKLKTGRKTCFAAQRLGQQQPPPRAQRRASRRCGPSH
jgi:hypothetical protein